MPMAKKKPAKPDEVHHGKCIAMSRPSCRAQTGLLARPEARNTSGASMWQGVKPKCVRGRWFSISLSKDQQEMFVDEAIMHEGDVCVPLKRYCILIPNELQESRILGKLYCIGCQGNYVIVQYMTDQCLYLQFLFLHLESGKCMIFKESTKYLKREFAAVAPVECLISPALSCALFRLPQPVMRPGRWCKLFHATITSNEYSEGLQISDIKENRLTDRKNLAIAFDPRFACRLACVMPDVYCSKCEISVYDVSDAGTKHLVTNKQHYLRQDECVDDKGVRYSDEESSGVSDGEESYNSQLLQCNLDYRKNGDTLVLCCLVKIQSDVYWDYHLYTNVYLFDSDTLDLLQNCTYDTETPQTLLALAFSTERHLFAPIFTHCDSWVVLGFLEKGKRPKEIGPKIKLPLPKGLQLQALTRAVILQHCAEQDVVRLPLPRKIISYLGFPPLVFT